MSHFPFQLVIPRRAQQCVQGQEPLEPGSEYYSVLIEDPEQQGNFQRRDFCVHCWDTISQKLHTMEAHSYWKSSVKDKKEIEEFSRDRDTRAMELLRAALQQDSEAARAEAFVLALYLTRRRLLILRPQRQKEAQPFLLYEVAETEEMLSIPRIVLSPLQAEEIQKQLASKLKSPI